MGRPEVVVFDSKQLGEPQNPSEQAAQGSPSPVAAASSSRASRAFDRLGRTSNKMAAPVRPFFDRLFDRLLPSLPTSDELNWDDEVDWARLQQEPLRARSLLRIIVVVVLLLLGWSAFAQLDEVTKGDGKVITSSKVQVIQTVDGGRVEEILVREGQEVQPGALLLKIDTTRLKTQWLEGRSDVLSLTAKKARLEALVNSVPFVMPPEVLEEAPDVAAQESGLYESQQNEVGAQLSMARQQLTQRKEELNEAKARFEQADSGLKLANQELDMTKPLLDSGAVSPVDIIRLEQAVTQKTGERSQASAQIQRLGSAITEAEQKIQGVELNTLNPWSKELSETIAKLNNISAGDSKRKDMVEQAEVRSPVRGTVQRLHVNTIGAVAQPGKELVEIVPLDDDLLLEAHIKPRDIAFLRTGMPARVKITAYDFSKYGGLDGVVEHISPDTDTDDKGNSFYVIRVRTTKSSLGPNMPITPGMVAEVDVLTGKKSVLAYLMKPVLKGKANAMTER
jgi:adhesin transport system membrane fusion protein